MEASTIWIVILLFFILSILGFMVWVFVMPSPSQHNCQELRKTNPALNKDCSYPVAMGVLDDSMQDPSDNQLFLADFSYSSSGGLPFCKPMWYRFRYVNSIPGNYSLFSKWTCSAVVSGGSNLPCPGCTTDSCDSKISGVNSCTFNRVVVGVTNDLQYNMTDEQSDGSINWAVVYRYVGDDNGDVTIPPNNDIEGEPLGVLGPSSTYHGFTNVFTDIGNNPCSYTNASQGCYNKCPICT